jgi:UDP:flavonoid glycosyltransferase YjiC (YdhE family)
MRVLFSSIRGPGHFHPLVPFIEACRRRGHEVTVTAPEDLRGTVERMGFSFRPFGHPGEEGLREVWKRLPGLPDDQASAIVVGEIFADINARAAIPALRATMEALKPDLLVREAGEFGSPVVADVFGIPHARVAIGLGVSEELMLRLSIESVDRVRVSEGLAADGGVSLRAAPAFSGMPLSLEDPEEMGPPTTLRVRAPRAETARKPLPAWWGDDSRPLVYVTFGTVAGGTASARGAYKTALEAIAELPIRVLLTTGHNFDASVLGVVPPNAHIEPWVPQADVFPHAAATVCHAGSGTMLGTLEAGVPMVAIPLFADQPANAKRIAAVGAGRMVAGANATAESVRAAIRELLADDGARRVAQRIAQELAALPPADVAVEAFEAIVANR